MVEAKKRAFLDRERWGADPRGLDIPLARLLSAEYAAEQAASIDPQRAADLPVRPEKESDTTYFCVVDAAGNAVSAIQSINSAFGSGVTAGDTGVLLNNRMAYWHLEDGPPEPAAAGHARAAHDERADGVQGRQALGRLRHAGRRQPGAGQPAGHGGHGRLRARPAAGAGDAALDQQPARPAGQLPACRRRVLTLEAGLAEAARALEAMGHQVKVVPPLEGPCSVEAIRVLENGVRMAGSDPRRDGWAAAY